MPETAFRLEQVMDQIRPLIAYCREGALIEALKAAKGRNSVWASDAVAAIRLLIVDERAKKGR